VGGPRGQRDFTGDAAEAVAGFTGSGHPARFAGNGIPRNRRAATDTRGHGEIANQSGAGRTGASIAEAEAGGMSCAAIEILSCDYVDGTLTAAQKAEVERHLDSCPACAALARDSAAAVAFMERAAEVEAPPELITRILFDAPWTKSKPDSKARRWLSAIL